MRKNLCESEKQNVVTQYVILFCFVSLPSENDFCLSEIKNLMQNKRKDAKNQSEFFAERSKRKRNGSSFASKRFFQIRNQRNRRTLPYLQYITLDPVHGPNSYNDTKPKMSSLLVFNGVYRVERHSVMLVFSTPLVNQRSSNLLTA